MNTPCLVTERFCSNECCEDYKKGECPYIKAKENGELKQLVNDKCAQIDLYHETLAKITKEDKEKAGVGIYMATSKELLLCMLEEKGIDTEYLK